MHSSRAANTNPACAPFISPLQKIVFIKKILHHVNFTSSPVQFHRLSKVNKAWEEVFIGDGEVYQRGVSYVPEIFAHHLQHLIIPPMYTTTEGIENRKSFSIFPAGAGAGDSDLDTTNSSPSQKLRKIRGFEQFLKNERLCVDPWTLQSIRGQNESKLYQFLLRLFCFEIFVYDGGVMFEDESEDDEKRRLQRNSMSQHRNLISNVEGLLAGKVSSTSTVYSSQQQRHEKEKQRKLEEEETRLRQSDFENCQMKAFLSNVKRESKINATSSSSSSSSFLLNFIIPSLQYTIEENENRYRELGEISKEEFRAIENVIEDICVRAYSLIIFTSSPSQKRRALAETIVNKMLDCGLPCEPSRLSSSIRKHIESCHKNVAQDFLLRQQSNITLRRTTATTEELYEDRLQELLTRNVKPVNLTPADPAKRITDYPLPVTCAIRAGNFQIFKSLIEKGKAEAFRFYCNDVPTNMFGMKNTFHEIPQHQINNQNLYPPGTLPFLPNQNPIVDACYYSQPEILQYLHDLWKEKIESSFIQWTYTSSSNGGKNTVSICTFMPANSFHVFDAFCGSVTQNPFLFSWSPTRQLPGESLFDVSCHAGDLQFYKNNNNNHHLLSTASSKITTTTSSSLCSAREIDHHRRSVKTIRCLLQIALEQYLNHTVRIHTAASNTQSRKSQHSATTEEETTCENFHHILTHVAGLDLSEASSNPLYLSSIRGNAHLSKFFIDECDLHPNQELVWERSDAQQKKSSSSSSQAVTSKPKNLLYHICMNSQSLSFDLFKFLANRYNEHDTWDINRSRTTPVLDFEIVNPVTKESILHVMAANTRLSKLDEDKSNDDFAMESVNNCPIFQIIQYLLRDIRLITHVGVRNLNGETALAVASGVANCRVIRALVHSGASTTDAADSKRRSAFSILLEEGSRGGASASRIAKSKIALGGGNFY